MVISTSHVDLHTGLALHEISLELRQIIDVEDDAPAQKPRELRWSETAKEGQAALLFVLVRALVVYPHSDLRVALCPVARLRLELQFEGLTLLGRNDLAHTQQQRLSCRPTFG